VKYVSLFSGIEAASVAWEAPLGWQPLAFAEIDPFASAVLAYHWPHVPNYGDVSRIDGRQFRGIADIVVGGSPCFPKGTAVLTHTGFKDISEVAVGDEVLTHRNRWRPVTATMCHMSDTVTLKGHGHPGLALTPKHRLWATTTGRLWNNDRRSYDRTIAEPDWCEAQAMVGKYWSSPHTFPAEDVPSMIVGEREIGYDVESEDFFWFVGYWLGNGHAFAHKRSPAAETQERRTIAVSCAHAKSDQIAERLAHLPMTFCRSEERTATRFTNRCLAPYRWLTEHFGKGAAGKTLPGWAYGMKREYRAALLAGYLAADGCTIKNYQQITTVSKHLALGIKMLAQSLGYTVSLYFNERPPTHVIEGRTVNQRSWYQLRLWTTARSAFSTAEHTFGLVRESTTSRIIQPVYNITVEEDHSYVTDSIVVKNCQDVSVAGKRAGFRDETGAITRSGLFFEMARIVDEAQPRYWLLENVPGMLSSQKGEDFKTVLDMYEELGYIIDAEILDAQHFGVPQRRRRVFVLGERVEDLFAHAGTRPTLVLAQCLLELATATLTISRDMSKGKKKTDEIAKYSAEGIQRRLHLFDLQRRGGQLIDRHIGANTVLATADGALELIGDSAAGTPMSDDELLQIGHFALPLVTTVASATRTHPSYWTAAEAADDFLREYRNYGARQASGTLFDDVGGVRQWRDFERQAADTDDALRHP
jgi:site-specific DNA-cytosine methylase